MTLSVSNDSSLSDTPLFHQYSCYSYDEDKQTKQNETKRNKNQKKALRPSRDVSSDQWQRYTDT